VGLPGGYPIFLFIPPGRAEYLSAEGHITVNTLRDQRRAERPLLLIIPGLEPRASFTPDGQCCTVDQHSTDGRGVSVVYPGYTGRYIPGGIQGGTYPGGTYPAGYPGVPYPAGYPGVPYPAPYTGWSIPSTVHGVVHTQQDTRVAYTQQDTRVAYTQVIPRVAYTQV